MSTTDPLTRSIVDRARAVTNPVELDAIRARMEYARLGPFQRLITRRPAGWGRGRWGL